MNDYELIDSGQGRRLERFGKYVLDRPDPEVLWQKSLPETEWSKADAKFSNGWHKSTPMPDKWPFTQESLKFSLKLTRFKHTGIFPEQEWEWKYITEVVKEASKPVNTLNLFAYTGAASLFAAKAGASVTHVDASKPAITWARENRDLNGMQDFAIRWIVDDVLKFIGREVKRGNKYDAIIMDPPVYGHGPTGTPWNFAKDISKLLNDCKILLSNEPLFVLVNAYAVSLSSTTLANALQGVFADLGGKIDHGELSLEEKSAGRTLSTGIWARWSIK